MVASKHGEARYEKISKLGAGTYGVVFKARDITKNKTHKDNVVAIKKIRMGTYKEGVSVTALREIKLLQEVKHPNVIGLIDVYAGKNNVNMVIELCSTDLERVIQDRSILLAPEEIKACLQMILLGIEACHKKWVLHRDLKPGNIFIGMDGNLKIGDFGLARIHGSPEMRLTHQVITRWYRPPELLYAARSYGPSVDIWSIGCIFAELMLRSPYLPGGSDIEQLAKIFQARGTPDKDEWPEHDCLPAFVEFGNVPEPDHRQLFIAASTQALDLMNQMLRLNPKNRISATDALKHPYFTEEKPEACSKEQLIEKIMSGKSIQDKDEVRAQQNGNAPKEQAISDRAKAIGSRRLSFSEDV